ncbi:hypothetical protein Clacol_008438 [Clathrus columnatus]|uniref:Uncharacterized protein n=1 Tax=Clathrus columnatus TaxID=1419009 RepID=A0AAV5AHQ5_9AGAM|nr:hypothetical protein Clacol_008438 [Clathrus columnatus]
MTEIVPGNVIIQRPSILSVCKIFLKTIDSDARLVYKIELFADGMVSGADCNYTAAHSLFLLRERRRSWKNLEAVLKTHGIGSRTWNAYELVDGIFAQTINTIEDHSSRGIVFASLPSRRFEGSVLKYEDVGFTFRDFAIDPTQDLVAFLQCTYTAAVPPYGDEETLINIFLRTMSTNKPHKKANKEIMVLRLPKSVQGAVIQIVNDIVGLMMWDENNNSNLFIWNWIIGDIVVSETEMTKFNDFAFISNRAYVLAVPAPESCFKVYTFNPNDGISLRATLYPPTPLPGALVSILGIHTGPFTTPNTPPLCFRPPKPFTTASEARIYVSHFRLTSFSNHPTNEACLVVIHNKTFLKCIDASERSKQPLNLTWEKWGVEGTAWIPGRTGSNWLRYVHGERLARLHDQRSSARSCFLEIYDFGAPRGPPSWVPTEERDNVYPTRQLALNSVFAKPIEFGLPCRLTRVVETQPYSGFMIDEDRIIGIKVSLSKKGTLLAGHYDIGFAETP